MSKKLKVLTHGPLISVIGGTVLLIAGMGILFTVYQLPTSLIPSTEEVLQDRIIVPCPTFDVTVTAPTQECSCLSLPDGLPEGLPESSSEKNVTLSEVKKTLRIKSNRKRRKEKK